MKNKFICFILILALAAGLSASVFAIDEADMQTTARLYYVTDEMGLLTEQQRNALEQQAQQISEQYACGVYIVIVDDYTDYVASENGIYDFATTVYTEYDLGFGGEKNGILLLMSMDDRDYALISHGYYGNTAFSEYGKDLLSDQFLDDFANDDWFSGFSDYLRYSERMMYMADSGSPVGGSQESGYSDYGEQSYGTRANNAPLYGLITVGVAGLAAGIVTMSMRSRMISAVSQTNANRYIPIGGAVLTASQDNYTHTTTSRVRVASPPSSMRSGSGGGASSGFSGKSGKF